MSKPTTFEETVEDVLSELVESEIPSYGYGDKKEYQEAVSKLLKAHNKDKQQAVKDEVNNKLNYLYGETPRLDKTFPLASNLGEDELQGYVKGYEVAWGEAIELIEESRYE